MSDPASTPNNAPTPSAAGRLHWPWHPSFWVSQLPYVLLLALTLFGVAYTSVSKSPIIVYWEILAVVIGLICIGTGWPHAPDRNARLRLIWTQALHWLAFLVAMNFVLLPNVQNMLNSDATGLTILLLLALGTFVAGVHILVWQVSALGLVMALCVPGIAWLEESALIALLIALILVAIAAALWWSHWNRSDKTR